MLAFIILGVLIRTILLIHYQVFFLTFFSPTWYKRFVTYWLAGDLYAMRELVLQVACAATLLMMTQSFGWLGTRVRRIAWILAGLNGLAALVSFTANTGLVSTPFVFILWEVLIPMTDLAVIWICYVLLHLVDRAYHPKLYWILLGAVALSPVLLFDDCARIPLDLLDIDQIAISFRVPNSSTLRISAISIVEWLEKDVASWVVIYFLLAVAMLFRSLAPHDPRRHQPSGAQIESGGVANE